MRRKHYSSDLSDQECKVIHALIPVNQGAGRKMTLDLREVLDAIFYVVRTGCQWRALPGDFPNWSSRHAPYGAPWSMKMVVAAACLLDGAEYVTT